MYLWFQYVWNITIQQMCNKYSINQDNQPALDKGQK